MPSKQIPATVLTADDASAKEELGARRRDNIGNEYRYVRSLSGLVEGYLVGWDQSNGATDFDVNPDYSECTIGLPAGVAVGTITANQHGWIQCKGRRATIKTDGGVSAGDALIWETDMLCDTLSAGQEHLVFAFATVDDTGSEGTALIHNCAG